MRANHGLSEINDKSCLRNIAQRLECGSSGAHRNLMPMGEQPSYEEPRNRLDDLQGQGSILPPVSPRSSSRFRWVPPLLVAGLSFVGLWVYFAPNRAQYVRGEREEAQKAAQRVAQDVARQESISELARRHGAVTDWRTHLRDRTVTDPIYSAELTPALINPERRPVLFIGSVRDVGQVNGKYVISLEGLINLRTHFLLHLSCSEAQAKSVIAEPRREDDRLAVVATVAFVDSAQRKDDGESSSDRTEINIDGQLLDFEYLGPYHDDLHEVLSIFRKP